MPQSGTLTLRVYASRAQLPISDATVLVSQVNEQGQRQLLSVLTTNESGLAGPITLPAPDVSLGLSPGSPPPFASYTIVVEHPAYQVAVFRDLQIFPGVETTQRVALIPLPIPEISTPEQQDSQITPQTL